MSDFAGKEKENAGTKNRAANHTSTEEVRSKNGEGNKKTSLAHDFCRWTGEKKLTMEEKTVTTAKCIIPLGPERKRKTLKGTDMGNVAGKGKTNKRDKAVRGQDPLRDPKKRTQKRIGEESKRRFMKIGTVVTSIPDEGSLKNRLEED